MRCVLVDDCFPMPDIDFAMLDSLPRVTHVYGTPQPVLNYLHWMEYDTNGKGQIAFVRNAVAHHPEMIGKVEQVMSERFPRIKVDPSRINILRTRGYVPPHVDESNRTCCINIGLRNADSALTWTTNLPNTAKSLFDKYAVSTLCEDGKAYLLDTAHLHAVAGDPNIDRYLVSYGFGLPFEEVLEKLKEKAPAGAWVAPSSTA